MVPSEMSVTRTEEAHVIFDDKIVPNGTNGTTKHDEKNVTARDFFTQIFRETHGHLSTQYKKTLDFLVSCEIKWPDGGPIPVGTLPSALPAEIVGQNGMHNALATNGHPIVYCLPSVPPWTSERSAADATSGAEKTDGPPRKSVASTNKADFTEGVRVKVIKKTRLEGKLATVMNANWNGLIKVCMDEEDAKGKIKTFKMADLEILPDEEFSEGDRVRIVKKSRLEGKTATVLASNWNGLIKVSLDEEDSKGRVKSFKPVDLELIHEIQDDQPRFQVLQVWEAFSRSFVMGNTPTSPHRTSSLGFGGRGSCASDASTASTLTFTHSQSPDIPSRSNSISAVGRGPCHYFIVSPFGNIRMTQDFISLILMLYDMTMIPLIFFDVPKYAVLMVMAWVVRIFWTLDICLSFVSGYVTDSGTIEMRAQVIAWKYVRSWFLLDLIVVVTDWLDILFQVNSAGGVSRLTRASRIFRVVRLIRMLRVARIAENLERVVERLNSENLYSLVGAAKLIVVMTSCGHLMACIWYAVSKTSSENWVEFYKWDSKPWYMNYVIAMRWSLAQFQGGMSEVAPVNAAEQVYAIVVFLLAYWSGTVFLSIITSSMTQLYMNGNQKQQALMALRRYLFLNGVSQKLILLVQRNAKYALSETQQDIPGLVAKVSMHLREKVHAEMYIPILVPHPLFQKMLQDCQPLMRRVCHVAMSEMTCCEGDVIFHMGEASAEPKSFIVHDGVMTYTAEKKMPCEPGTWISEASLWTQWVHRGFLRSVKPSRVHFLRSKEFSEVVRQFKSVGGYMCWEYAASFINLLNEADDELVHDLLSGLSLRLHRLTSTDSNTSRVSWRASFNKSATFATQGSLSSLSKLLKSPSKLHIDEHSGKRGSHPRRGGSKNSSHSVDVDHNEEKAQLSESKASKHTSFEADRKSNAKAKEVRLDAGHVKKKEWDDKGNWEVKLDEDPIFRVPGIELPFGR